MNICATTRSPRPKASPIPLPTWPGGPTLNLERTLGALDERLALKVHEQYAAGAFDARFLDWLARELRAALDELHARPKP